MAENKKIAIVFTNPKVAINKTPEEIAVKLVKTALYNSFLQLENEQNSSKKE